MSRTRAPDSATEPYLLTAVTDPLLHPDVGHAAAATGRPVVDLSPQLDGLAKRASDALLPRHIPRAVAVIVDRVVARELAGPRTHDHIFVVVRDEEEIPWEDVLACHADQVFYLPAQASDLLAAIADLPHVASGAPGGPTRTAGASSSRGKILAVTSTAGGAGASTLAAALARTATRAGHQVVLIDGVETSGGLDLLLGLEGNSGARWPDLNVNPEGNLDADALRTALPAEDSGLALLSAARPTVAESFQLQPETLARVANTLAEAGMTVIVDAPAGPTWLNGELGAHPLAGILDQLVMLTPAQVRAAAAATSIARRLAAADIPHCLVVRHRDWSGLDGADLTRLTGLAVTAEIPTVPKLVRTTETAGLPTPLPTALNGAASAVLAGTGLPGVIR